MLGGEVRSEGHRTTSPDRFVRVVPVPSRVMLGGAGPSLGPDASSRTAHQLAAACENVRVPGDRASAFRTALYL